MNLQVITSFLKSISSAYQDDKNEIIIHCPYCDDSIRKNAQSHGHLYVSKQSPVFHCFRCETSGFLGALLKDLGFENQDVLSELGAHRGLFSRKKNSELSAAINLQNEIFEKNKNFKFGNPLQYEQYQRYLNLRLGNYADQTKYLISPEIIDNKLCASFQNITGDFVTARIIGATGTYRYIRNKGISAFYYFQDFDFDRRREIIITEGVFDGISLYKYSLFSKDNGFYLSILGKNYPRAISWLIEEHLLIGTFTINLIFDTDNKKNAARTVGFCQRIVRRLNNKIKITGWVPTISKKDVGEFPIIQKV